MTFKDIWSQLLRKNADLGNASAKIEFTSENLERLLRQVYEQGQKSVPQSPQTTSRDDMFRSMFGM